METPRLLLFQRFPLLAVILIQLTAILLSAFYAVFWIWLLPLLSGAILLFFHPRKGLPAACLCLLLFCAGLIHAKPDFLRPGEGLPNLAEPISLEAEVLSYKTRLRGGETLRETAQIVLKPRRGPLKKKLIRLSLPGKREKGEELHYARCRIVYVEAALERPEKARLPGGYDGYSYARSMGWYATGRLKKLRGSFEEEGNALAGLERFFLRLQDRATEVGTSLFRPDERGVLAAMGWGDKQALLPDTEEDFRLTGLIPMLVVSGAHVAWVMELLTRLLMRLPGRFRFRLLLQLLGLTFYAFLCQWEPSVTRAWLMTLFRLLARMKKSQIHGFHALTAATFVYLLVLPERLFHLGFQMSSVTTAAIQLYLHPACLPIDEPGFNPGKSKLYYHKKKAKRALGVLVVCQLVMLPYQCLLTGRLIYLAPLLNLLFSPLAALITSLALPSLALRFFLGEAGMAPFFLPLRILLRLLLDGVSLSRRIAGEPLRFHKGLLVPCMLLTLVLVVYLLRRNRKAWWRGRFEAVAFGFLFLTGCIWLIFGSVSRPYAALYVLDVGQGDALLVRASGRSVLIDSGKKEKGEGLSRALDALGISELDAFILTHRHEDHFGGSLALLKENRIRQVFVGGREGPRVPDNVSEEMDLWYEAVQKAGLRPRVISKGDRLPLSKTVLLRILHPPDIRDTADENQNSIIIRLEASGHSLLLMGDAEEEVEKKLLDERRSLKATGLKIGHHGAKRGTTRPFLEAVRPSFALLSVGRNRYGHPAPNVLQYLQDFGCEVFRTDRDGTLTVSLNKTGCTVNSALGRKKTWQAKPPPPAARPLPSFRLNGSRVFMRLCIC